MDELGQKLLWTTLELETLKSEAEEEIRNNKVYVDNLIYLLKQVIQERDETRDQLQNLANKTMLSSTDPENSSTLSHESPFGVHSFLDPSSVQQDVKIIDQGSMITDSIAKGRALPRKGKFLQAVLEAGPLLETLLVAGPLPSLQNPSMAQLFQVPPVSSNCLDGACSSVFTQTRPASSVRCSPMACGTFRVSSNMLNSTHVPAVSCLSSNSTSVPLAKRQRFC